MRRYGATDIINPNTVIAPNNLYLRERRDGFQVKENLMGEGISKVGQVDSW